MITHMVDPIDEDATISFDTLRGQRQWQSPAAGAVRRAQWAEDQGDGRRCKPDRTLAARSQRLTLKRRHWNLLGPRVVFFC